MGKNFEIMNLETTNPLLQRAAGLAGTETSTMDLHGTVNKTGFLLLLCIGSAAGAWMNPELNGLLFIPLILAFVFCMVAVFAPKTSPFTAPAYAICEGAALDGSRNWSTSRLQAWRRMRFF